MAYIVTKNPSHRIFLNIRININYSYICYARVYFTASFSSLAINCRYRRM